MEKTQKKQRNYSGSLNKLGKLAILNNKVLEDQDVTSLK